MSMTPHRYDLIGDDAIAQGAEFYRPFAIEAVDGTTINLATEGDGYTVGRLVIKDQYSGTEQVTLDTDNGGVVIGSFTDTSGSWSGYWFMSAAATATLTDWGDGVYDFEIATSSGPAAHVERPFYGVAVLSPEVST
jgi:hypothetical protein